MKHRCLHLSSRIFSFALLTWLTLNVVGSAWADTVKTIEFDPPNFTNGQVVTTVNDVTFEGSPVVFIPAGVATFTAPQALGASQWCESEQCNNNANRLVMHFAKGINKLTVRIGTDWAPASWCFPEATTCPTYARLVGYDANDNAIADSNDVLLTDVNIGFAVPITTVLQIAHPGAGIRTARIFVGSNLRNSQHNGNPTRVQIDDVVYSIPDVPPPPAPLPSPPKITINSPVANSSFPFPYQIVVTGNVIVPGGLFAFCHALNGTAAPPSNSCVETNLVDAGGNFTFTVKQNELIPNANTIRLFAYDLSGQMGQAQVQMNVGKPPAPQIVFYGPVRQVATGVSPVTLGYINAPGGLTAFCLSLNNDAVPSVNDCLQKNLKNVVDQQGFFKDVPLNSNDLKLGENTLHGFVYDQWGSLGKASYTFNMPTDLRVTAIEVTQGIQVKDLPPSSSGMAVYRGVHLVKGRKTIARVFANSTATGSYQLVPARLEGKIQRNGVTQSLGTIRPYNEPVLTAGGAVPSWSDRANPNGAYIFVLPQDWTWSGTLTLTASVNTQGPPPTVPECNGCLGNNEFTLTGIEFRDQPSIIISPVELTWTDSSGNEHRPPTPGKVLDVINAVAPVPYFGLEIRPYAGSIDITDVLTNVSAAPSVSACDSMCSDRILDRIANFEIRNLPGYTIGIVESIDTGLERGVAYFRAPFGIALEPIAYITTVRPLTIGAHEFFHQLAYFHAGGSCPNVDLWVDWPPDNRGVVEGIGLDMRPFSGPTFDTFRVIAGGAPGQRAEYYDFMSYCAGSDEMSAWISVRNWEAFGGPFPNGVAPTDKVVWGQSTLTISTAAYHPAEPASDTLRIMATANLDGSAAITSVRKGVGGVDTIHTDSPYHIVVRDQSGNVVSNTPVTPIATFRHHDKSVCLSAEVRAKEGVAVEIQHDGQVVAQRKRSSKSPNVVMVKPAQGTRIGITGEFVAQWTATDPDGDIQDVTLEYSADDGKTYRSLFVGGPSSKVSLPVSLLTDSDQARLRVIVNDGFNEGVAVSDKFIVEGSAPTIEIGEPIDNMQIRSGVSLRLVGRAFDNAKRLIPNNHLHWFSDKKAIGTGSQADAVISPGRHEIRLEATDQAGKVGFAKVSINVVGEKSASKLKAWLFVLLLVLVAVIIWAIARWKLKHP
jgi:hypothetical protein